MDIRHPLKPRPGTKFMKRDVEKLLEELLKEQVGEKPYSYSESMAMSKELCAEIQQEIQKLDYERYKIIVQVNITEACSQGIRISSRCLWDPEVDNFAEFTYSNESMHVTAVVFGLYWE